MRAFVARQPVFDQNERIFAYDLALRGPIGASGLHEEASAEQLVNEVFVEIGLDRVAEKHGVLLTANREMLMRGSLHVLPADRVIIQIPADAAADARAVAPCAELAKAGYRLALQALPDTPFASGLMELAELVNVDVGTLTPAQLVSLSEKLKGRAKHLMATNVRHSTERDRCAKAGFDLFAGYRFSAPETFTHREIGIQHVLVFRVLKLVRDPNAGDQEIEELIQRDVGLSVKLLRIVNSASVGGREIWSIGHALRLLGREQVGRWLTVLLVSDGASDGVRAELTQLALLRARMCELLAEEVGLRQARGPLFLVGMLSVLDQLLEVPMQSICDEMDLAGDVRAALLHRKEFFGDALRLVESYVNGAWDEIGPNAERVGFAPARMQSIYLDALAWASSQRQSAVAT